MNSIARMVTFTAVGMMASVSETSIRDCAREEKIGAGLAGRGSGG